MLYKTTGLLNLIYRINSQRLAQSHVVQQIWWYADNLVAIQNDLVAIQNDWSSIHNECVDNSVALQNWEA